MLRIVYILSSSDSDGAGETPPPSPPPQPPNNLLIVPNPRLALENARNAIVKPELQFAISMKKSFVEDDCRLPLSFDHCEKFMYGFKDKQVRLGYVGQEWLCKLEFSQDQYRLGEGWRDCVIETGLNKEDVVSFTRVYGLDSQTIYKKTIYRA